MQKQAISLLGLATRARKTISGEELVIKEVRARKASVVLISNDASDNTMKKVTDKCTSFNVPYRIVGDRYELGGAIGKDARVVVAVSDRGFGQKLLSLIDGESKQESKG